jgi:hypothetical protein
MKPILPEELSALLDGELPAERAAEVRQALADNTTLRQEFERLTMLDANLKACAATAAFAPRVSLARGLVQRRAVWFGLVAALLALRWLLKVCPPPLSFGLEIAVLCFVIGWGLRYLLQRSSEDLHSMTQRPSLGMAGR